MSSEIEKSNPGTQKPSSRRPSRTKKLDNTLQELESAFADWEKINSTKVQQPLNEEEQRKAQQAEAHEKEFKQKTRHLFNQLAKQLSELND